jgi:integrase
MSDYRLGRLNGRWVVTWWEDGRRKRYRLDARTKQDAERQAIDVIRRRIEAPTGATVADLWELYRREKEGRQVATAMHFQGKAILPHFGHLRPDQVTVETCRSYTALRREAGKSDGTTWTELGHLRTVFRWAESGGMLKRAPRVERPQKPAPKDRWLNNDEIDRLLGTSMAHHIKLSIILMLATAARVGAILDLRWCRVDTERGQIDLRSSDIGPRKGRAVVPMNAMARAALQQAREVAQTEYVIEWAGKPVKSIKTGFYAAARAAGLDISPHDLRHTSAVHLAAAGIPMARISQYLGHSNTSVTERVYARFAPDHLREEADVLDFTKLREVGK